MAQDRTALFVRVPTPLATRLAEVARVEGRTKQDLVTDLVASGIDEIAPTRHGSISPDILDLDQLADYLRVVPAEVVEKIAEGGLPGRRFGTEWRFSTAAVAAWMAGSDPIVDRPTGFSRQ